MRISQSVDVQSAGECTVNPFVEKTVWLVDNDIVKSVLCVAFRFDDWPYALVEYLADPVTCGLALWS